ncbi:Ig-like domain-containing protein [Cryobacterium roopkundense]|uniref:BIG2 domain-containing protein n=1 Tax=Cryobacterium roopkundense TaxID=1001240 RepID=A0A7W9E474_9MICO|nr:Ig-like domain-containing protein [Cryobacterium roopkundense]MBB5641933.1 hypothetical protein [Cryobacterium roopkundense]
MNAQTRRYLLARAQEASEEFPAAIEQPLSLGLHRYRARLLRVFAASAVLAVIVLGVVISVHPTTVAALETLFPASSTSEATLVEISVTPGDLTVQIGEQGQLTAQGRYSDDTTVDLKAEVKWTSADPDVVGVDDSGLIAAMNPGASVITATLGTIQGSSAVTVLAPGAPPPAAPEDADPSGPKTQTGITIIPESVTLAPQETQQLEILATFSDDTTAAVTGTPQWSTDNMRIARVDEAGLLTAGPFGEKAQAFTPIAPSATTTVRAELDGFTADPVSVTVDPLKNFTLTVSGVVRDLLPGETLQLTATLSDGKQEFDVTDNRDTSWTCGPEEVAEVDTSGAVTANAAGTAVITASWRSLNGQATVDVTAPPKIPVPDTVPDPLPKAPVDADDPVVPIS